jgi:hypothetical protein
MLDIQTIETNRQVGQLLPANVIVTLWMQFVKNTIGKVTITFFTAGQHWIGIADMIKLF